MKTKKSKSVLKKQADQSDNTKEILVYEDSNSIDNVKSLVYAHVSYLKKVKDAYDNLGANLPDLETSDLHTLLRVTDIVSWLRDKILSQVEETDLNVAGVPINRNSLARLVDVPNYRGLDYAVKETKDFIEKNRFLAQRFNIGVIELIKVEDGEVKVDVNALNAIMNSRFRAYAKTPEQIEIYKGLNSFLELLNNKVIKKYDHYGHGYWMNAERFADLFEFDSRANKMVLNTSFFKNHFSNN